MDIETSSLHVVLGKSLVRHLKWLAISQDRSLKAVVENALEEYLDKFTEPESQEGEAS